MKHDYREERHTNEWQRKSGHIKERDNYTCRLCGCSDKYVHVYHRFYDYDRYYWEYPDDVLVTLCEDCHNKEHKTEFEVMMDMIKEAVQNALHGGVMYLEIIKSINSMAETYKPYLPAHGKEGIFKSKINNKAGKPIVNNLPQSINDRKRAFLEELSQYGLKYESDYLQSFSDYWTQQEGKKLRFENAPNFLMPSKLSDWEAKSLEIKKEIAYQETLRRAEEFGKVQLNEYKSVYERLIVSQRQEIEVNTPPVKVRLLEMFRSKEEEMKQTKVKSIIPFSNPNTTVYNYLMRVNRPAAFAELYQLENKRSFHKEDGKFIPSDTRIIDTCIGKHTHIYPELAHVKAIEEYFGIDLWLPIPFTKSFNYMMDDDSYLKRQIHRYMMESPEYREDYIKKWGADIGMDDFQMLYEANLVFRMNDENNLKRLGMLEDMPMQDFCLSIGIKLPKSGENTSLKMYLKKQIKSYHLDRSLHAFSIAPCAEGVMMSNDYFTSGLISVLKKLNEAYGFTFLMPYNNSMWWRIKLPLEILSKTNGYEFDYCTESFNKGTMTSVRLPERLESIDYYCDKIQALCNR